MYLRSVESGPLVVGQASTASAVGCWNLESSRALGVYADASVAPSTHSTARTFINRVSMAALVKRLGTVLGE